MNSIQKITKSLGFKAVLLGILILLMLIPVILVRQVVLERARRAEMVEMEILDSWGGELEFAGPLLRIPCLEQEMVKIRDGNGRETLEIREHSFNLWITPLKMEIRASLDTTEKRRGIFSVPVFSGDIVFTGDFDPSGALSGLNENQRALAEEAEVVIVLANQKGIRGIDRAEWDGAPLKFESGDSGLGFLFGGIHGPVSLKTDSAASFHIGLSVQGGKRIRVLPLGGDTLVNIAADWPAPSYQGHYLPGNQTLDQEGFEAQWQISSLSRGIPLFWSDTQAVSHQLSQSFFGVDFIKVLDHYALNERAVKYTILFIIVPFLTLFLLEIFAGREIHPVQYLLAGIGNIVFYLLLLSLSEHIPFHWAYFSAALGVTVMMGLYSRSLLGDWRKSWSMIPVTALSYLYLFLTLQSEDWALLIGSLGAFGITGLIMFVTRNVDWYGRNRTGAKNNTKNDSI